MRRMVNRARNRQAGFILSMELVFITTIVVIGLIVGWVSLRDAAVTELADIAAAWGSVNQTYSYDEITGHASHTDGSFYTDVQDFCDNRDPIDEIINVERCIDIDGVPSAPES